MGEDNFSVSTRTGEDIDEDEMSRGREAKARGNMRMGEPITPDRYEENR